MIFYDVKGGLGGFHYIATRDEFEIVVENGTVQTPYNPPSGVKTGKCNPPFQHIPKDLIKKTIRSIRFNQVIPTIHIFFVKPGSKPTLLYKARVPIRDITGGETR
jgi:hypothetical protein